MNKVTIRNRKTNEIRDVSVDPDFSCPIDESGQFYDLEEWEIVPDISALFVFAVVVIAIVFNLCALIIGWR